MPRRFLFRLLFAAAIAVSMALASVWLERALDRRIARGEAGLSSGEGDPQLRAAFEADNPTGVALASVAGKFVDTAGRERPLASLVGEPFVLSLVYTRCTTVCPRTIAELQRLERDAAGGPPMRFVLVSLDPEYDVPDTLASFAAKHALDPARWTLLTPEGEALQALASVLGVARGPDAGGGVVHSAVIAMVDSAGDVRSRHVGLGTPAAKLLAEWNVASGNARSHTAPD
jgi:protein SCO1/2